jgi:hypothetical protein
MEAAQELYSLQSELLVAALIKFGIDTHVSRRVSVCFFHFENAETINLD